MLSILLAFLSFYLFEAESYGADLKTDEKHIVVKNKSFPDLPTPAGHYVDFSGFPLPSALEKLLKKHIAPAILLLGEPNYRIKS